MLTFSHLQQINMTAYLFHSENYDSITFILHFIEEELGSEQSELRKAQESFTVEWGFHTQVSVVKAQHSRQYTTIV